MLLPVIQFIYNATPQKRLEILPFKVNYSYKPKTLLTPIQAKKISKTAKERMEKCKGIISPLLSYIPGALRGCQG